MEELKTRIVALNLAKNNYAAKKMKGDASGTDDKDLISSLIYVIAECRRVASDIGISDDGKINRDEPSITIFKLLNQNVNDLKKQVVMLTESTQSELKEITRGHHDQFYLDEKEKREQTKVNDEKNRQIEIRDRLREKLASKDESK